MAQLPPAPPAEQRMKWITLVLAFIVLVPCAYGFIGKFIEFVHVFSGDPGGVFAITPMVNYLSASAGFLCLLMWAAANGMFHDIEGPKHQMLAQEQELDSQA